MSDSRELVYKIIIDTKDGTANVQQLENGIVKLTTSLLGTNATSKEAVNSFAEFIKNNNLTEQQINQTINALEQEKNTLGINSNEYRQHNITIANVRNAYSGIKQSLDVTEQGFTKTYQRINTELVKYNTVNQESVQQVAKWIQAQNLSAAEIDQVIKKLNEEGQTLDINGEAWKQNIANVLNLKTAYATVLDAKQRDINLTKNVSGGYSSMNMALGQLGYGLSDAGMFFVDMRMGMMGVMNNFPMFIQNLQNATNQARVMGTTLKAELIASLTGGMGLLLAVQMVSFAMMALPNLFDDSSSEAGKLDVTLDELTKTTNVLNNSFENIRKEVDKLSFQELADKYDDLITSINESEGKLKEDSFFAKVWQGLTFKPLTSTLGYTLPWQDWFSGPSSKEINEQEGRKAAKTEIEEIGNKIKYFLDQKYTVKELMNLSPKERDETSKYLGDILNDWAENVNSKTLYIGDKLKGNYFDLGTYSRAEIKKMQDEIEQIDNKSKKSSLKTYGDSTLADLLKDKELRLYTEKVTNQEYIDLAEQRDNELAKLDDIANQLSNKKITEKKANELKAAKEISEGKIKILEDEMKQQEAAIAKEMNEKRKRDDEEMKERDLRYNQLIESERILNEAKIQVLGEGKNKEQAQLDEWYREQKIKFIGNKEALLQLEQAYQIKQNALNKKYDFWDRTWERAQQDAIISVARTIEDEIGGAFRKVFGEADTLLNNLLANFLSALTNAFIEEGVNYIIEQMKGGANKIQNIKSGSSSSGSSGFDFFSFALQALPLLFLADGAIVRKPTLAVIGEGKEEEAVLPLSKLNQFINYNTYNNLTTINKLVTSALTNMVNETLPNKIAMAAEGAIFTKPTLSLIGEGKEAEGVFPLSKLNQFLINNTVDRQTIIQPVPVTIDNNFDVKGALTIGLNDLQVGLDLQKQFEKDYA